MFNGKLLRKVEQLESTIKYQDEQIMKLKFERLMFYYREGEGRPSHFSVEDALNLILDHLKLSIEQCPARVELRLKGGPERT